MTVHGPRSERLAASADHYLYNEWLNMQKDPSYKAKWPTSYTCFHCGRQFEKPLRCSACKSAIYCSKQCAKEDWKPYAAAGGGGMYEGHKDNCAAMKEQMNRLDDFNRISEQFPWVVKNGNYYDAALTLASLKLRGTGSSYGWWAVPPGSAFTAQTYGQAYLQRTNHWNEIEGWKLPEKEIPWLNFDESKGRNPPKTLPDFEDSWTSYYQWRGLPLSSPAALLLHWPLAVYRMLRELGITAGSADKRRSLKIFLLGLEKELEHVPIFGELALLFPYCDLQVILFGASVFNASKNARKGTLAAKPILYECTAPKTLGGGTIKITMHTKSPYYDPAQFKERPDAIIALNAGVTTYPEWFPVIIHSIKEDVPFAVTDYVDASLDECDRGIPGIISQELMRSGSRGSMPLMTGMMQGKRKKVMNEFMCPAAKAPAANYLPSGSNAWVYIVNVGAPSEDQNLNGVLEVD
ncbi:hypothetical protein SISSUDRAFT_1133057 [Sistotremastrum suecicum HHB10207 ss-3]|uniref:MYND-type domain-containing protein n=1 Tax=Sistotremastrum suecicum HHB10207 ss-3 TaxID=1314776 RepID=A0A165XX87_9AGAM|nr:hypothetical protein SISSUDRAFT_1133057 [Sistotremastrum suecicum HHB10207 ss-3]